MFNNFWLLLSRLATMRYSPNAPDRKHAALKTHPPLSTSNSISHIQHHESLPYRGEFSMLN